MGLGVGGSQVTGKRAVVQVMPAIQENAKHHMQ